MDFARTFFVTAVTWQRRPIFRDGFRAKLLLEVFFHYRRQGRILLHEFVIMPDHLHLLITPAPNCSLERAIQFIKGGYSYRLGRTYKIPVWQQSFSNHRIHDAEDFANHRGYILDNPVRAGLVEKPEGYPFSSANFRNQLDELALHPEFKAFG
jgi:putative transposase